MKANIYRHYVTIDTVSFCPFRGFNIFAEEESLVKVEFVLSKEQQLSSRTELPEILKHATAEILAYFAGDLCKFSVPLCLHGTAFQKACGMKWSKFHLVALKHMDK